MIVPSESGLTESEWLQLGTLVEDTVFDVTLYAWNPQFTLAQGGGHRSAAFDGVLHNGHVYRLTTFAFDEVRGDSLSYTPPTGAMLGIPPSLVSDGDLYAFVVTATGISRASWDGSVWSSWTEIVTDSTVAFLGATSASTCHFVTLASNRYRFQVAVYDGSWTVTGSDTYWGFPLLSFSAKRLGAKDVLTFIANLPGTPSTKVVNTEAVKYILPAGACCAMTYRYGTWSDHVDFDHIDSWSLFRYRANLKLTVIGDTLWMTAYSSEGTAKQPVTGLRLYSSKDGLHWSRGELLAFDADVSQGLQIVRLGTTLYAFGEGIVYAAPSTLGFGSPHADTILDLTPYIQRLSVNRRDIQQASLTVDNADHWIDDSILNGDVTCALLLSTGFWMGSSRVLIPTGLFEVDSVDPDSEQPDTMVEVTARDRFAWMSSKTQSEQFVNWLPQGVGLDEYIDTTGTGYGGMSHTAPASGSFKAHDGILALTDNNVEGLAFSTFLFDCWNGAVQGAFDLPVTHSGEYGGLIFRMQDKDNGYIYRYDLDSDTLVLEVAVAGVRSTLWTSAPKGWTLTPARPLRVEFNYSRVRLYSSSDTWSSDPVYRWTLEQSLLIPGHADAVATESGYVGFIGKGYSTLADWSDAPDPIGGGELPPGWDPYEPPTAPLFPPEDGSNPLELIVFDSGAPACHVALSLDMTDATPNYTDASTGLTGDGAYWACADPWGYSRYFCLQRGTNGGLFRNDAPFTGGSWTRIATNTVIFGTSDLSVAGYGGGEVYVWQVGGSINRQGYFFIHAGHDIFLYSTDYGVTWTRRTIGGGAVDFTKYFGGGLSVAVSTDNNPGDPTDGYIYAMVANDYPSGDARGFYRSRDWGDTWTNVKPTFLATPNASAGIVFPYTKVGGARNQNGAASLLYATENGHLYKTDDSGATWEELWAFDGWGNSRFQYGGPNIDTYTHDGGIILLALLNNNFSVSGDGGFINRISDLVDGAVLGGENHQMALNLGNAYRAGVHGYSLNPQVMLIWYYDATQFAWTVNGGSTVLVVNAPAGYTGVALAEFALRLAQ